MFITNREVEIRSQPGFNAPLVGTIGPNIEINVIGTPVTVDGWLWYQADSFANLWIPERPVGGDDASALLHREGIAQAVSFAAAPPPPVKSGFSVRDGQFYLDGKPFKFVGLNMRELAWYGFPGSVTQFARPEHQDLQLDVAKEMRARVVRMYAPFSGADTETAVKRLEEVLNKLQKRGMYALVTLDDAKGSGFNVPCDGGRYRVPSGYNADYFAEGYHHTYVPFVKTVIGRLAGHEALFAWGVCNEAQVHPHPPLPPRDMAVISEEFYQFYKFVTQLIRDLDPNTLITTSIESCHHLFVEHAYQGKNYADLLYTLPTIDFATIHSYRDREQYSNPIGHRSIEAIREVERARTVWKKPIIMEELGPVGAFFNDAGRSNGGEWVAGALNELFDKYGYSGVMQWGFQATTDDIGAGDADSGMHRGGVNLPSGDWQAMFNVYQNWGSRFWA